MAADSPRPDVCPFCGKRPEYNGPLSVGCRNSECGIGGCGLWLTLEEWNRRASSASAGTLTHEDLRILTMVIEDNMEVYTDERQKEMKAISNKLAALADAPATRKEGK